MDYIRDEEAEDEYENPSCSMHRPEFFDCDADCGFFKKYRTRKRKEQSSKCDGCPNVEVCGCIESTETGDMFRHYIAPMGVVCMKGE